MSDRAKAFLCARTMAAESLYVLRSKHLGNERNVWIRRPAQTGDSCSLVVFLDAELYRDRVGANVVIDDLELRGVVRPSFYVFVSSQSIESRWRECPCYPPFARFINDELVPWIEDVIPEAKAESKRVIAGLSYTGLAAAFVALDGKSSFAKVIAQSGSFWSNQCWLTREYRSKEMARPVDFYLDVGLDETATNVRHKEDVLQDISQIEGVQGFRDVLLARGYAVNYIEFQGGHDTACWRTTLPIALEWALSAGLPRG